MRQNTALSEVDPNYTVYLLCNGITSCKFSALFAEPMGSLALFMSYRKTPKISDTRKLSCNTPKIQIKGPNLRVFLQKDSNGIANSEDPDQTAPLGAV